MSSLQRATEMRRLGAVVVVLLVVAGVLGVILIDSDSDQPGSSRIFRQKLSATERAEARRLVAGATDLRRILGDHRYAVKAIGVWDARVLKGRGRELLDVMTVVRVAVEPPLETVRAQWPLLYGIRPCRRQWVPFTVTHLREVFVYVDLTHSLVDAIVPGRYARIKDWRVPRRRDRSCPAVRA
jgi:hypothetical protein